MNLDGDPVAVQMRSISRVPMYINETEEIR